MCQDLDFQGNWEKVLISAVVTLGPAQRSGESVTCVFITQA